MTKIILLNGPAGSGKDTIGNFLIDKFPNAGIYKFADPIKKAVAAFFELSPEECRYYFETQAGKNNPSPRFNNKSPREWLISFSEDFAKKCGGPAIFGTIMSAKLRTHFNSGLTETAIITDSGFVPEAEALLEAFYVESEVYLIRLHRNSHTFDGDSRNYISLPEHKLQGELDLRNEEGSVERAVAQLIEFIKSKEDDINDDFTYPSNYTHWND